MNGVRAQDARIPQAHPDSVDELHGLSVNRLSYQRVT